MANVIHNTIHPLPLPPFGTLHSLSLDDLKRVCRRHAAIHSNLSQAVPATRKETTLRLPLSHSAVFNVAFIPGGSHLLTMSTDGVFSCWDVEHEQECPGEETQGKVVGKLLASFETEVRPTMWNFHVAGGKVLVALYGTTRR